MESACLHPSTWQMHARCMALVCRVATRPYVILFVVVLCVREGHQCGYNFLLMRTCAQGWDTSPYGMCGREHLDVGADPQFMGSATFDGYTTQVNHEIDIEVPALVHTARCRR